MHLFIHLSYFFAYPNHLRWFNLSFDSEGARFNRPYIFDRFTFSAVFIFSIQLDIACWLRKRCCTSSLCRGQHSLVWSKAPLAQLSYKFPRPAKEIVVDIRRGSSSRNFPHVALVRAILTRSQHLQDRFCRQDNETTPLYQAVCLLKLHTFQIYHTLVCKASYIFYIYAWEQLSIYL